MSTNMQQLLPAACLESDENLFRTVDIAGAPSSHLHVSLCDWSAVHCIRHRSKKYNSKRHLERYIFFPSRKLFIKH